MRGGRSKELYVVVGKMIARYTYFGIPEIFELTLIIFFFISSYTYYIPQNIRTKKNITKAPQQNKKPRKLTYGIQKTSHTLHICTYKNYINVFFLH